MTTTTRNEAAERLLQEVYLRTPVRHRALELITEALAAERRVTVERIRERLIPLDNWLSGEISADINTILDEEAAL